MNLRRKLTHRFLGIISLLALLSGTDRIAGATEPSGVTATVLNRATVPEFDARRKYRQKSDHRNRDRRKHWKIELEATRTIDVVTVLFTVQPGGHSGWHTHPGPAIFTVSKGTLTMYEADDPSCRPQLFPAGRGSIEADTAAHHHMLRNETDEVAETIVTFLLPVGALLRTDLPDPGQCPF